MERFSEKVYLSLQMPTEDLAVSDEKRIRLALEAEKMEARPIW